MPQKVALAFAITQPSQVAPPQDSPESTTAVSCAIDEALSAVASPAIRARLLGRALRVAGLSTPPSTRSALQTFVEGALYDALVDLTGVESAESVLDELRVLVRQAPSLPAAASGVRAAAPAGQPDRSTARTRTDIPLPRPSRYPTRELPAPDQIAILVSPDATLRMRFEAEGIAVLAVSTLAELADALGTRGAHEHVVLVDARLGVPASADRRLSEIVPDGTRIVIWGTDRSARMLGAPRYTVRCDPHATEWEVASALRVPVTPTMPAEAPPARADGAAWRRAR
jgi:hypothetical protein